MPKIPVQVAIEDKPCDQRPVFATNDSSIRHSCPYLRLKKHNMAHWRERITNHRYFYHYLFWAIVFLSYFVDTLELRRFDATLFHRSLVLKNGLLLVIVYFHLRVLIPAFLDRKRYAAYTISVLLTIVFGTLLTGRIETSSWKQIYAWQHTQPEEEQPGGREKITVEVDEEIFVGTSPRNRLILDALTVCRYLVISILLKFIDDFFLQRGQLQQVQHEKTMAELNVLKAQINPHFLFNTLNNLYGLVLERSDLAAETVLKLADIMKYTLSEGDAESVPLKKDLDNLRHYFDLELLRLPDTTDVAFTIEGNIENQQITPLLLLPLIENAFKHGVHRSRDKPFLKIAIRIADNTLNMTTVNHKPMDSEPSTSLGLGIQNVRKRLNLLYPGRYRLEIAEHQPYFSVTLQIQIA